MKPCACCKEQTDEQFLNRYERNVKQGQVNVKTVAYVCDYCELDEAECNDDNEVFTIKIDGKNWRREV